MQAISHDFFQKKGASAQEILRMLLGRRIILLLLIGLTTQARCEIPTYTVEQGVALAGEQNPEILVARKKVEAARGGLIAARSGYLPSLLSTGLADKRQSQTQTQLRNEDYSVSLRALENVYTGGAVSSQVAIAKLKIDKENYELEEIINRVTLDVRTAFYDVLLNRAKVRVHEDSVRALEEELKTQRERLQAGMVGTLNVHRAEVTLANERPELINAKTQLKNSYLRLGELLGIDAHSETDSPFEIAGQLQYEGRRPDLNECLARADADRVEIKARQKDIEIEDRQYIVDRSDLRPQVQVFSGYEVYSERDPAVGPEFNHGYIVGVNGTWHLFDGFAAKGRMLATRARRDAAIVALDAARRAIASEVRGAFLDLEQADKILESETKNVQSADESLEIARKNLGAGLGTQLDVLQAAADVTRTRTTRLSAIHLHNVALARLARACGTRPEALDFGSNPNRQRNEKQALDLANPPPKLSRR
jgi:outer membrane protein